MKNIPQIKRNKLSVLFWLFKSKKSKRTGLTPIYCRVTLNAERPTSIGFPTSVCVHPENWQNKTQMISTGNTEAEVQNQRLLQIKTDLQRILAQHELAGGEFTALDIQNTYLQKYTPYATLQDAKALWDKRYEKYLSI